MTQLTDINLDPDAHRKLRHYATASHTTPEELAEHILIRWSRDRERADEV